MKHLIMIIILALFGTGAALASPREEVVEVPLEGGLVLTGKLHLPASDGAVPAVILYPGSQGSRHLPGLAEHLAANGIAALDLKKRGVEGSGGSWRDETIARQAGDALAAVRFLQTLPGIDGQRIGIAGHSQGGWVAQLAAARSPDVAYVVLLAGPAQTVLEQILSDERNHLIGWGVPEAEADGRIAMFRELLGAGLTNPHVCGPEPKHYLCGLFTYDPAEALAAIKVPVLALFGERDPMTPPRENVERMQQALAHLGPSCFTVRVFPSANHVFWAAQTGLRDEYARLDRSYVPGFLAQISDWIAAVSQRDPSRRCEGG